MNLPSWLLLVRSLASGGDIPRAISILEDQAARNDVRAIVELSQIYWRNGRLYEASELIAQAEGAVRSDDSDGHFALHLALAIGVGHGEYEERQRKAFDHLLSAARESEDARMKLSVGLHYWQGLNCVPQDWEAANAWLGEAAKSGVADIVATFKKFSRAKKRASSGAA